MAIQISELVQMQAANENNFVPDWVADVPDDWSEIIAVTSEFPAMHRRQSDQQDLHKLSSDYDLNDAVNSESENAKAA